MIIRDEIPADAAAIHRLVEEAFRPMPFSDQTEQFVVDALRRAGAMTLSLVAEADGSVVGHVAFSPATIDGRDIGWFGLGPLAVAPDHQRQGIGSALVREGLARLAEHGAAGCLLVGNPAYYGRFGFRNPPDLVVPGVPPQAFQVLPLSGAVPTGTAAFHPAFAATA